MPPGRETAAAVALLIALAGPASASAVAAPASGNAAAAPPSASALVAPASRNAAATPPSASALVARASGNAVAVNARGPAHGDAQPPPGPVAPEPPATPPLLGPDPNAQDPSLGGPGPLVTNGLGSPSCRSGQLSAASRADCASSGVAVAPAPLDNYGLDVHIDTGIAGATIDSVLQDLLVKPIWTAVVWLTDVAVVALDWCFSLELVASGTLGPIARGLTSMRDALTTPWLAPVLAVAAIGVVYNGIVRRRVVDTVGALGLLLAMMAGGLWVIADPSGTVGAASQLVNQASLGALGAAATGDPNLAFGGFDDALRPLFEASVASPWCYLEFGNVAWCAQPGRRDPRLVATARDIVAVDRAAAGTPAQHRQADAEAAAIGRAETNGELFLALPANGPRRNSINADAADPSLLNTLCGGDDAGNCPADTGPQAEFRTKAGTVPRLGGLLLIVAGDAGMFALIGFICLRLLGAALLALLYLLLAPVAVLAPALGDGGREAFRRWSLRLLGAVLSKLVYSVFLGVVLLMVRILADLGSLGWWAQWLLIAAFWWLVFANRHRLLENVIHERAESARRATLAHRLFAAHQAVKLATPPARALGRVARRADESLRSNSLAALRAPGRARARIKRATADEQVGQTLERDHARAVTTLTRAPELEHELADLRARRERIGGERRAATGNPRRFVGLRRREQDVQRQIETIEQRLADARAAVPVGAENRRRTGLVHDATQRTRRAAALAAEAELRPRLAGKRDRRVGQRDYARLAGWLGRPDYEQLRGGERLRAQLAIDRVLDQRRATLKTAARLSGPQPPPQRAPARPVGRRERQFDQAREPEQRRR